MKYRDLPAGALFRFADGVNDPTPVYRKLRDNLAGYGDSILSMHGGDDVEPVDDGVDTSQISRSINRALGL